MKLLLLSTIILTASVGLDAQTTSGCPEIKVIGPNALTRAGDTMNFSVDITGDLSNKLSYQWTISAGTIFRGQEAPDLIVQTDKDLEGATITATVRVIGLRVGCPATASESAVIDQKAGCGRPLDKFGPLKRNDLFGKIDNLYIRLERNSDYTGHIRITFSKDASAKYREKYLNDFIDAITFLKKDPSRVSFEIYDGGYETVMAQLWLVPPGADLSDIEVDRGRLVYGNEFKKNIQTILQNL